MYAYHVCIHVNVIMSVVMFITNHSCYHCYHCYDMFISYYSTCILQIMWCVCVCLSIYQKPSLHGVSQPSAFERLESHVQQRLAKDYQPPTYNHITFKSISHPLHDILEPYFNLFEPIFLLDHVHLGILDISSIMLVLTPPAFQLYLFEGCYPHGRLSPWSRPRCRPPHRPQSQPSVMGSIWESLGDHPISVDRLRWFKGRRHVSNMLWNQQKNKTFYPYFTGKCPHFSFGQTRQIPGHVPTFGKDPFFVDCFKGNLLESWSFTSKSRGVLPQLQKRRLVHQACHSSGNLFGLYGRHVVPKTSQAQGWEGILQEEKDFSIFGYGSIPFLYHF